MYTESVKDSVVTIIMFFSGFLFLRSLFVRSSLQCCNVSGCFDYNRKTTRICSSPVDRVSDITTSPVLQVYSQSRRLPSEVSVWVPHLSLT